MVGGDIPANSVNVKTKMNVVMTVVTTQMIVPVKKMRMKKMMAKLYLDLDGVFADFASAVRRYTGSDYDPKSSWQKIDKIPRFFQMLYPLSGALRLYDTIKHNSRLPIEFLTSSPDPTGFLHSVVSDKIIWVRKYLDRDAAINVVRGWEQKALFAQPGCILVDDSWRNIRDFVNCGGAGVHHTSNYNTLQELGMMGVFK